MKNVLLLLSLAVFLGCEQTNQINMGKRLNKKSDQVTVLVNVSYTADIDEIKKYIRDEQCPLFF